MGENFWSDPMNFFQSMGAGSGPGSMPMPTMVSASEVRHDAKAKTRDILRDWDLLQNILQRHEATIQRRWSKKSRQQRLDILTNAWPNMSTTHRPDFQAFRRESEAQRTLATRNRDAYMWPYVNQEDLSKPRTLLLLLNTRGRHHPTDFAAADGEVQHLGIVSGALSRVFLNEHTMLLNGVANKDYGRLLSWDDHEEAFNWMNERIQYQPGDALLILEAQQRLLSFLVACSKKILHDIPETALLSDEYNVQPEPPSKSDATAAGFDSLASMAAEAPYRPPSHIDFDRIVSLLAAREASAQDHLWALREDPSYFAETVLTCKEHRQELLKDDRGQPHPLFRLHRETVFWERVLGNVVTTAYIQLEMWTELRTQAESVRDLKAHYARDISPNNSLPAELLNGMLKFQHYLNQMSKGPRDQMKHSLIASPPWRPYFVREPPPDSVTPKIAAKEHSRLPLNAIQRELFGIFQTLWEDGQQLFLLRQTDLVGVLNWLIETEPQRHAMISGFIGDQLADLSIVCECLRQLSLYQPWANNFEDQFVDKKEGIMREFAQRTSNAAAVMKALKEPSALPRLGDPSDKKFDYPVERRRNKENTEAMILAESNLDAFWAELDQLMQKHAGGLRGSSVRQLLTSGRELRRTAPWVEPSKRSNYSTNDVPRDLIKPLSQLYFDLERRSSQPTDKVDSAKPKTKVKTRGQPAASTEGPTPGLQAVLGDQAHPVPSSTFKVDARALKVFKTLFYTPSLTATPGEIPWTDFLHAMAATGFKAEKLAGSAWQFTPTTLDVERGIQFHEPHPISKIPFRWARNFGRRLFRAYGWEGGMFLLKEKEK